MLEDEAVVDVAVADAALLAFVVVAFVPASAKVNEQNRIWSANMTTMQKMNVARRWCKSNV